MMHKQIV